MTAPLVADVSPAPRVSAIEALHWWIEGAKLAARAPLRILAFAALPLVVEGLLQLVPQTGVLLSKVLAPLTAAGGLLAARELARGHRPSFSLLFAWYETATLQNYLALMAVSLLVFASQLGCAALTLGSDVAKAVLLGHPHPVMDSAFAVLLLILPGMLLVSTPLMLTIGSVIYEHQSLGIAISESLRGAAQQPIAFMVTGLLTVALVAITMVAPFGFLFAIPLLPILLTTGWISYSKLTEARRG